MSTTRKSGLSQETIQEAFDKADAGLRGISDLICDLWLAGSPRDGLLVIPERYMRRKRQVALFSKKFVASLKR